MAMQSLTTSPTQAGGQNCRCGCAPCNGTCCGLECLEQPNFFCGQLLTDQDLKALIQWTQGRLGLSRFRHGWGVVCGLQVRCDPKRCGFLYAGPGYAVSCCGDDIIVCKEDQIDLSTYCTPTADPCAGRLPVDQGRANDRSVTIGGCTALESELRLVDIMLRYKEAPSAPQSAIGRSVCKQVSDCEFGRTKEIYELIAQPVFGNAGPSDLQAEAFVKDYNACIEILTQFNGLFKLNVREPNNLNLTDIQRWLLQWIDRHPLTSFCCLHDRICGLKAPGPPLPTLTREQRAGMTDEQIAQRKQQEDEHAATVGQQLADLQSEFAAILFWIVQDCRNACLACACFSCQSDAGVPLARVWLRAGKDPNGQPCCSVLAVDNFPPYRRPIGPDCWPAPRGHVNVGQVIWHDRAEASAFLARYGVTVNWEPFNAPSNPAAFPPWYLKPATTSDGGLFLPVGNMPATPVTGYYYIEQTGLQRVVGFAIGATAAPVAAGPPAAPGAAGTPAAPAPTGAAGTPAAPAPSAPVAAGRPAPRVVRDPRGPAGAARAAATPAGTAPAVPAPAPAGAAGTPAAPAPAGPPAAPVAAGAAGPPAAPAPTGAAGTPAAPVPPAGDPTV